MPYIGGKRVGKKKYRKTKKDRWAKKVAWAYSPKSHSSTDKKPLGS